MIEIELVTLFPEMFASFLDAGLLGKAVKAGLVKVNFTNPRDFASGVHRKVDDAPYGGGVGMLMQDVHVQYHQTRPWLLLAPGKTYTSSAMPQKANPGVIQDTRALASDVVASLQAVTLRAHNVTPGMTDYKYTWSSGSARTFVLGTQMLSKVSDVMASLRIDPKRSLEELESDWTTSMELAETLQREHRMPFRVGHHFASEVVLYARAHGLRPKDFPYAEAVRIYAEASFSLENAVNAISTLLIGATLAALLLVS